jgi:hypothetical protein
MYFRGHNTLIIFRQNMEITDIVGTQSALLEAAAAADFWRIL